MIDLSLAKACSYSGCRMTGASASMFQSASTQRPSQLSLRRWRCKDICQVTPIGNLPYVILVIHAQISGTYCWIASIFLMHVYSLSQSMK